MRVIGDIHGRINPYLKIIEEVDNSVQIGDFGIGFLNDPMDASRTDFLLSLNEGSHRFIRGNHDNPAECAKSSHWIADGTIEGDTMYIGGALSIDHAQRTEGVNWWRDEELSYERLNEIVDLAAKAKPRVIISHECPETIAHAFFHVHPRWPSRTRNGLESLFKEHQPELWIFGHWHANAQRKINGTHFVCLNELSYIDI